MNIPSVAVVILNYNGKHYLEIFLPALLRTTYINYSIHIIDNASTDDSVGWISHHYPMISILENTQNLGYAGGYNWGLKQIEAAYYILLNSDVEVTPEWIDPVIDFLEKTPTAAVAQPKILSYHQPDYFEYAGAAGGWLDKWGYAFARGRIFYTCEKDEGQYNTVVPIFWASGAALFIKADLFHKVEGFDTYFFAHMEEIDLCWRVQNLDYTIYAVPQSVVYHVGGGTLSKGERKAYLNYRNNLIMLAKNLPTSEKIWKLPFRLVLDGINGCTNLIAGDWKGCRTILKSHFTFYNWLFFYKTKQTTPKPKKMKNLKGVWNASVVWAYFIKKEKKFSKIIKPK